MTNAALTETLSRINALQTLEEADALRRELEADVYALRHNGESTEYAADDHDMAEALSEVIDNELRGVYLALEYEERAGEAYA